MKTKHLLNLSYTGILCMASAIAVAVNPVINSYKVYYGSLHNHTNVSDGTGTPAQAYDYAKNTARLDFFGLADHSNLISSTEWTATKSVAEAYNEDGVFAAFHGFEWTTYLSYGHVTVVNTDDYCSNTSPTSSFKGLLSWLNARNGIAFFNHPGWDPFAFKEFEHFAVTPSDRFVGMELWNDMSGFSKYYYNDGYFSNDGGKGYYDEALIRKWKSGAAGADDNHDGDWGTATDFRVGVLANNLTRNEILDAFKARRFFSTLDKNLALSFRISNAEMGSTVAGGNLNVKIEATDADPETFTEVVLIKNGVVLKSWTLGLSSVFISEFFPCSDGDYLYARVKQLDGGEAISSPIWISGNLNQPPTVSITSPANGATYSEGETVTIAAAAGDPDGTVARVDFYQNSVLLGSDTAIPYEFVWTGVTAGTYSLTAVAYDNLNASATSGAISIVVNGTAPVVVNSAIAKDIDDAEEYLKGQVLLNDADIDLVYDSKTSGNQTVGLFFRNLNIPAGATITKATIRFTSSQANSNKCSLTIKCQKTATPADFAAISKNLSSRIKTTASVAWKPGSWTAAGLNGTAQQTPDLSALITEVINAYPAFAINNLVFLITGSGTRNAYAWDASPVNAATLQIEYTNPATSKEMVKSGEITGGKPLQASIEPVNKNVNVRLYPNPVQDKLTIRVTGEAYLESWTIFSVSGVRLMEGKAGLQSQETVVDCGTLLPGMYLISVKTGRGSYPVRFIRH